jgi:hypothetical protein
MSRRYADLASWITQRIRKGGYELAQELSQDLIGILEPRGKIGSLYIGRLWLRFPPLGAGKEKLVMEVFGRENLEKLTQLARELTKEKEIRIELILAGKKSRVKGSFRSSKLYPLLRL